MVEWSLSLVAALIDSHRHVLEDLRKRHVFRIAQLNVVDALFAALNKLQVAFLDKL